MKSTLKVVVGVAAAALSISVLRADDGKLVFEPGHPNLKAWLLPAQAPHPADNQPTAARAGLGQKLFFDPRLSATGQTSCASCHLPERGWSDGYPKSIRLYGTTMSRASPTIVNTGYNSVQLWDGRSPTLEHQAENGISPTGSLNAGAATPADGLANIQSLRGYQEAFERAYPGAGINAKTVAMAIASFERTIVSNDSPFDRWVKGEKTAMSPQQVRGFALFAGKANCAVCHSAPNFTDNGFHNIGLASTLDKDADVGRYKQRPVALMRGAFKTPTLRDISLTAPYFHDGSARNLAEAVEHYVGGGNATPSLSPNMKPLELSAGEKEDLVAFMQALTTPRPVYVYPVLPRE